MNSDAKSPLSENKSCRHSSVEERVLGKDEVASSTLAGGSRTLAIIKPDAIERRFVGKIITEIEEHGFSIVGCKIVRLWKDSAEQFYREHEGKDFFPKWIEFMVSGPVMVLVLEKWNAVEDWRRLMGIKSDETYAFFKSIRGRWAEAMNRNLVHGSDSNEAADREIKFFFDIDELDLASVA